MATLSNKQVSLQEDIYRTSRQITITLRAETC